nr:hypothetical protein [Tanacetum cinerariifolium]
MATPTNNIQMHNDIMAVGSKERPPMLAPGTYAQRQSLFLRYVEKSNKKELNLEVVWRWRWDRLDVTKRFKGLGLVDLLLRFMMMGLVVGAWKTERNRVVQQSRIQCFSCKGFRHFTKECRKPKQAKDYVYHKEKMMLCKQEEKGMSLIAKQDEWLYDTNEDPDKQELEAHYMYMAKIQEHSEQPESINDTYMVETVDSNVIPNSSDIYDNEEKADPNAEEYENERVMTNNLIANLKLDTYENKKIQNQLKKQAQHSLMN